MKIAGLLVEIGSWDGKADDMSATVKVGHGDSAQFVKINGLVAEQASELAPAFLSNVSLEITVLQKKSTPALHEQANGLLDLVKSSRKLLESAPAHICHRNHAEREAYAEMRAALIRMGYVA
jgi:hypothetical protein